MPTNTEHVWIDGHRWGVDVRCLRCGLSHEEDHPPEPMPLCQEAPDAALKALEVGER